MIHFRGNSGKPPSLLASFATYPTPIRLPPPPKFLRSASGEQLTTDPEKLDQLIDQLDVEAFVASAQR